jgi:hypothetical protein
MFTLIRRVVGTLLLVSGLLQLLGLPGDMPASLSLHVHLEWRTIVNVTMMLVGLALMFGFTRFFDRLSGRRRAVTSLNEVRREEKWRDEEWVKESRARMKVWEQESRGER